MDFREWLESDYYHLIGVTQTASDEEINKAYRLKAKQIHPDIFPLDSIERDIAEQNFKKLLFAKDTLLDPEKRSEYDKERQVFQDCYVSYISTSYSINQKNSEPPPKKSNFKEKLKEILENEETETNYDFNGNVYQNHTEKYREEILTKEEYAEVLKKERARELYNLGIKAIGYKDYYRAKVYFKSCQYLDPTIRIPTAYLYMLHNK